MVDKLEACPHEAWDAYTGGGRRCVDCGESLSVIEQFAENAKIPEPVNFMETATRRVVFDPPAIVTHRMVAQLTSGEPVDGGTDVPKPTPTEDARERVKVLEEAFSEMRRYMYDRTPERRELVVRRYQDNLMRVVDKGIRTTLGNKETDRHG